MVCAYIMNQCLYDREIDAKGGTSEMTIGQFYF